MMRGATLKQIQKAGRWANLAMVQRYSHLSPAGLEAGVRLLDEPLEEASRGHMVDTQKKKGAN
jgi:hypothetical protein